MGELLASLAAVIAALAVVLVLAWLSIKALKRLQDRQGAAGPGAESIRFIRTLAVGPRERVTIVEVRGERLLLGVTAGGIAVLKQWPADAPVAPETRP